MPWTDALTSFLHFLFLLILVGSLAGEGSRLRQAVDARGVQMLSRTDALYGVSALALIAVGFLRVFYGAKPADFYLSSPFFWAKVATFLLIGAISILPTLRIMRWRKAAKADSAFVVSEEEAMKTRRLVMAQMHLLPFVILFAVLMARGYGF